MKFKNQLALYKKAFGLQLSSWMAYRFNFYLFVVGLLLFNLIGPALVYLIYYNSLSFPGWTLYQVMLLSGIFIMVTAIDTYFFGPIQWQTQSLVLSGDFDKMMVHPIRPLTFLFLRRPEVASVMEFVLGLGIVMFSAHKLQLSMSFSQAPLLLLVFAAATVFMASIRIINSSLIFYFTRAEALAELVNDFKDFVTYPISIYGATGMFLFSFVFPIGIASFYPAQVILGTADPLVVIKVSAVAITFFIVSLLFWSQAIKKYTSAGG
jgi:ABC-2 type transport system permease protein